MAYNEELEIRMLLERYMDGESTLKEESRLKEYFSRRQDVPADLMYAKAMFGCFESMSKTASPKVTPFVCIEEPKKHRISMSKIMSMAASLIIGVIVGGSIALINQHRNEILASEIHQKVEEKTNSQRVYGYINGQPITDVHEACYRGAMSLKTMGVQMNKPSRALAGFEVQKASLSSNE